MAHQIQASIDNGTAGLTLKAALIHSGTVHTTFRNVAVTEIGQGFYELTSANAPDGYYGVLLIYTGTIPASPSNDITGVVVYSVANIAPTENENADVRTSSIVTSSGSGAFAITVTVTDGTNPLQNATVRVTEGINSYTVLTDGSGNGSFSLDPATYEVSITKSGYSFTPENRTVTGNQAGTLVDDLEMAAIVITPPADPTLCRLYGYFLYPTGQPAANEKVEAALKVHLPAGTGQILVPIVSEVLTDVNGYAQLDVIRTDAISPSATYTIICTKAGIRIPSVTLTTPTRSIESLI